MKIQNRLALVTATAITAMFVTQAKAQYRPVGDDGIAASPKVRQMLNEQQAQAAAPRDVAVTHPHSYADGILASPKLREQLEQNSRSFQVAPIK